jgi:hypothetical protein
MPQPAGRRVRCGIKSDSAEAVSWNSGRGAFRQKGAYVPPHACGRLSRVFAVAEKMNTGESRVLRRGPREPQFQKFVGADHGTGVTATHCSHRFLRPRHRVACRAACSGGGSLVFRCICQRQSYLVGSSLAGTHAPCPGIQRSMPRRGNLGPFGSWGRCIERADPQAKSSPSRSIDSGAQAGSESGGSYDPGPCLGYRSA